MITSRARGRKTKLGFFDVHQITIAGTTVDTVQGSKLGEKVCFGPARFLTVPFLWWISLYFTGIFPQAATVDWSGYTGLRSGKTTKTSYLFSDQKCHNK